MYADFNEVRRQVAEVIRPPRRLTVADVSDTDLKISIPGGYSGPFKVGLVPYMREPMEVLTSRKYSGVVFAGPAQSAKTQCLVDNFAAYMVKCNPCDMMIVQTTKDQARDFSRTRVDRMHRTNKWLAKMVSPGGNDDNVFDKYYRNGATLRLAWPAVSMLSGKAVKYIVLTDYDRMPNDVDGEGTAWGLASKRPTTFLSSGICVAESSPGTVIEDPKWEQKNPHEAPPVGGILSLYNTGDRRIPYWKCPRCGEYFNPTFDLLTWENLGDINKSSQSVVMACPNNGCQIEPGYKREMNVGVRWLRDGERILPDGQIEGEGRISPIASFWMQGPVASFQTWPSLVSKYLIALDIYESTGDELNLKTTVNTDQGRAYKPLSLKSGRSSGELAERANRSAPKKEVPNGVRFLLASVDVGLYRFDVKVVGFGVGLQAWVIDRFALRRSPQRTNDDQTACTIEPASYLEDWDVLISNVIKRRYPLSDGTPRTMPVLATFCDIGGTDGVTERAYSFWVKCKENNLESKFWLVKGANSKTSPMVKKTYPDSSSDSRRKANAKGRIPVLMMNVNSLKDSLNRDLSRNDPGPGYVNFPGWLGAWYYDELTSEQRTDKGWVKHNSKRRNESWDLMTYIKGGTIALGAHKINWENPPRWAMPWDHNYLLSDTVAPTAQKTRRMISKGIQ